MRTARCRKEGERFFLSVEKEGGAVLQVGFPPVRSSGERTRRNSRRKTVVMENRPTLRVIMGQSQVNKSGADAVGVEDLEIRVKG